MFFDKKKIIIGAHNFEKTKQVKKLIKYCVGNGVDKIDTAIAYKNSEKIIGNTKEKFSKIITKIPRLNLKDKNLKKKIFLLFKNSTQNLQVDNVYCLMLHEPRQLLSDKGLVIFDALQALKKEKKIKKIGISVYEPDILKQILKKFKIDLVQFPCNYLNKQFLEKNLINKLVKLKVEIHVRSIFLKGILSGNENLRKKNYFRKWNKLFNNLDQYNKKNKISNVESCLSFVANKKFISGYVISFDNLKQCQKIIEKKSLKKINHFLTKEVDKELIDPRFWRLKKNMKISKGQKKWNKAKKIILGGNMILSKRPDMFLPLKWPSYFSKAKGCNIWDLSGKKFIDMSMMGIGTNILGYGNKFVDKAVKKVVADGNMSTLNCPEEVELAEKLLALHPWAGMVKLARSGGEANAIAIRIARAATGKDKVAICGYHGWHDWYLSANLSNKNNLNKHLLEGLEPAGVPKNLKGSVVPFKYNNFKELEMIVKNNDIGVVKMEVTRNDSPKNNFLQKVRNLCTKKGIVLIFDECSSGFRQSNGGMHKIFKVTPDMAMFGKAMGNGYAITAVIGKKDIMNKADNSFISSTFWSERIGPTAAIATLKEMKRLESWKIITTKGNYIKNSWKQIGSSNSLDIKISGMAAIPSFSINSSKFLEYKTYITQEMLKRGFLGSNIVYLSISHQNNIIDKYLNILDKIFKQIKECEEGKNIYDLLETPVCSSGFKRLN